MSRHLDAKVHSAARDDFPHLPSEQVERMERGDLLKLLAAGAAGAAAPIGGVSMAWAGGPVQVSAAMLDGLEDVITVLASRYAVAAPQVLLGAVMGHLEEVSGLLRGGIMQPSQRARLEAIVADVANFVGTLSILTGRFALADAHFGAAEKLARQAGDNALVSQALELQSLLHYHALLPGQVDRNPGPRVALLEEAEALATRHGAPVMQVAICGWLAENRAAMGDAYGADAAIERSWRALDRVSAGDTMKGFGSSVGRFGQHDAGKVLGFQGAMEVSLGREGGAATLGESLSLRKTPDGRALCLTELAAAFVTLGQPEEACADMAEAHAVVVGRQVCIMRDLYHVRATMPPEWSSLSCVRALDEQLRQPV